VASPAGVGDVLATIPIVGSGERGWEPQTA
jgi:hypothetical protein